MKLLLPILAILLLPTSAAAAPTGTLTDTRTGATFTIAATDAPTVTTTPTSNFGYLNTGTGAVGMGSTMSCYSVWNSRAEWQAAGSPRSATSCVKVGGQTTEYLYGRLRFADVPAADAYRFVPSATLYLGEYIVEGQVVGTSEISVNNHQPGDIGSPTETYCNVYTLGFPSSPSPGVARTGTPPSVYAACAALGLFTRHEGDPAPTKPVAATPQALTIPASAAKCGEVSKVVVRSTNVKCASARTVIAKYAKSLKSPAGWTCSAVVTDDRRRVRCAPKPKGKAAAKAAVYGVWRS